MILSFEPLHDLLMFFVSTAIDTNVLCASDMMIVRIAMFIIQNDDDDGGHDGHDDDGGNGGDVLGKF